MKVYLTCFSILHFHFQTTFQVVEYVDGIKNMYLCCFGNNGNWIKYCRELFSIFSIFLQNITVLKRLSQNCFNSSQFNSINWIEIWLKSSILFWCHYFSWDKNVKKIALFYADIDKMVHLCLYMKETETALHWKDKN